MNRRSVLMTVGSIGAGAGAIFGSGAFTTVSAERQVKLTAVGDASAKITLQPGSDDDVVTTASSGAGAVIEFADSNINEDAITVYEGALNISSNADESIDIYVDDSTSGVGSELFFVNDSNTDKDYITNSPSSSDSEEISGDGTSSNAITISSNDNAKVIDIVIDLRNGGSGANLPNSKTGDDEPIKFVADPTN